MSVDIEQWLENLGLGQYAEIFRSNDIDFRALVYLNDSDLKELGVSLGHRRILLAEIATLQKEPSRLSPKVKSAEHAVDGRAERRQLTVMFCDLVGSTQLSMQLDPEDLREVLQRYQNLVTDAVVRYNGYVARFSGDGVLAYFGWPHAYEDQAERAVRAALDALPTVEGIVVSGDVSLRARIGIATGQVVVGDLIGKVASDFKAVIGETPNLAARLQDAAEASQIVISSTTRRLIGTAFDLEELPPRRLKGFSGEVHAWRVIGESVAESRFDASRGDTLTRLVGRDHELGLLHERWDLARDGEGQVVLLSGEAGIGKSRLVKDFRDELGDELRFNLHYQCSPLHTHSAFYPVIHRLQRAAGFTRTDSNAVKLEKLDKLLKELKEDVDRVGPLFAALLSLQPDGRHCRLELTPQQLRQRTIEMLVNQVLNLSRQRPVSFVLEDAHWIDPSMSDFIDELIPRIANYPVMMLITYRPEYSQIWSGHTHLTSVSLNRLGRRQGIEIASYICGTRLAEPVIERIVRRADGVPLYVEELTKSVLEYRVHSDNHVVEDVIPATLQSSLEARLDRLEEAKEIAQVGAVIGREFSLELLSSVSDKTPSEFQTCLDRLVQSGMVFRRGSEPHVIYTFKHSLVQDAAYATILLSRRRRLHEKIFQVIESHVGDDPSDIIDALAHHAFNGEVWEKAFVYLQRAGSNAMDRAAVREAVAQFEKALLAGSNLPETRESVEQAIDLRFNLRNALWSIAGFEEILELLKNAERLAKKIDDPTRIGWISVYTSASLWQLGRSSEALAAAREAISLNEETGDLSLAVGANFYLGCVHVTSGDLNRAESLFQNISDLLQGDLRHERCGLPFAPAVIARSWLVWALAERGEFAEADARGQEGLRIAEEISHPFNLAHILYDLGYYYGLKGEFDKGISALERAYEIVQEWSLSYWTPFIRGFLGHVYALSGELEKGTGLLRHASSDYESLGMGLFRSLIGVQLGEALLIAGHLEQARSVTERALTLARKRGERGHEAYALRLLGEIAIQQSSSKNNGASEYFGEALQLANSLGMYPLVAHCHQGLWRFYQHQGNSETADEHAAEARGLYQSMEMTHWTRQLELIV